jgi:hypothetical protein
MKSLELLSIEAKQLQSNLGTLASVSHMHSTAVQHASNTQELPASIVLSCAIAESNRCHTQHVQSSKRLMKNYLDSEIEKQERILEQLKIARSAFNK